MSAKILIPYDSRDESVIRFNRSRGTFLKLSSAGTDETALIPETKASKRQNRCDAVKKINNRLESEMCPRVKSEDYILFPPLSPDIFYEMESMACARDDSTYPDIFSGRKIRQCFFFVRDNLTGKGFVDIYIQDSTAIGHHLQRFVICDGYALVENEEARLLAYIRDTDVKMLVDDDVMDKLYRLVADKLPHWHYQRYPSGRLREALEHLYFASHRSGCREILYKAGLHNIAFTIDATPFHDPLGSNPEKIIGHGIPLRLLRILNDNRDLEALQNEEALKSALHTYRKYSGFTEGYLPSKGQWEYLKGLSKEKESGSSAEQKYYISSKGGFNRKLYRDLKNDVSGFLYRNYLEYLWLWDELSLRGRKRLPAPEDLNVALANLRAVKRCRDEYASENQKIAERKENEDLDYEGEEYCILMPSNCLEFGLEGLYQKNCVASYIYSHAEGRTTILFLRKKSTPDKSFVTVEVRHSMIIQVYAKMNTLPDYSTFCFLEEYSREKEILLDPYQLATREIIPEELEDEYSDNPDYLRELIKEGWDLLGTGLKEFIQERYEWKPFPCEDPLFSDKVIRMQMTLEEIFPDEFRHVPV